MTSILFGECLKLFLTSLDISNNRLSKAINVDSSLVNRWIHGKRVPPYHSNYIESITEYLSHNVHNTLHEQQINLIYFNVFAENGMEHDISKKIQMVLLEAQGHSIEYDKRKKQELKHQLSDKVQTSNVTNEDQYSNLHQDVLPYTDLSTDDKVIFGVDNIFAASFYLLDRAANHKSKVHDFIYITYRSFIYSENTSHFIKWREIIQKAINNGWKIILLVKMNHNTNRIIRFMNYMFPLIQTGKLILYYIKNYESIATGDELVVVPDIGVLSSFSTDLHSGSNCGLYITNKSAIHIYQSHFHAFLEKHAQPLMRFFSDRNDYCSYLTESEDNIGNRFLYRYCFSVLTLPEHLYEKFIDKKKLASDAKNLAISFYRKRLSAFHSNIQTFEYKDVYMTASIKDLMKTHQFYFYSNTGNEAMYMDPDDIIEYLENIIHLLQKYENYKIAFLPESHYGENMESFCCVVKERITVLFEANNQSPNTQELHISITEPSFVKSTYEYFNELWEQIAPAYREKSEVIAWLKYQITILQRQVV